MQQVIDTIRTTLLEEFSAIPIAKLLVAVLVACLAGILISVVYRLTFGGVIFEKQFMFGLILMSMITSTVILAISSNLVLSLGMVGALSIVRFRTAIKEPMDTVFMFWALAAGILVGAGFFIISILATLALGILFTLVTRLGRYIKADGTYLLVIYYSLEAERALRDALQMLPRYKVKTKRLGDEQQELVLELPLNQRQIRQLDQLRAIPGIREVNLVSSHTDASF